jgi:hypothetical protein
MSGSLRIVGRNLLTLLGIFAVTSAPFYLLSLLFGQAGLTIDNILIEGRKAAMGPIVAEIVTLLVSMAGYILKVICCAFVTEKSVHGEPVSFIDILKSGITKMGKVIITLTPLFIGEIVILVMAVFVLIKFYCLGLIMIIPILFFTIFQLLLINAVSLRDYFGWKAYSYAWALAKGDWWSLITSYVVMSVFLTVVSCPVTIPFMLLSNNVGKNFSSLSGIAVDLLSVWLIVGITLLYLDLEKYKNPSAVASTAEEQSSKG